MAYSVYFLPESRKKFDKLPVAIKNRMENRIKKLADFPNVRNCIKVQGRQDTFRLRVGDYRALFRSYFDKETRVVVKDMASRLQEPLHFQRDVFKVEKFQFMSDLFREIPEIVYPVIQENDCRPVGLASYCPPYTL